MFSQIKILQRREGKTLFFLVKCAFTYNIFIGGNAIDDAKCCAFLGFLGSITIKQKAYPSFSFSRTFKDF
jgi:hypothetical protein